MVATTTMSFRESLLAFCVTLLATLILALSANAAPATSNSCWQDESAEKAGSADGGARFDPVIREIEGWRVHLDPALLEGDEESEEARAIEMLANHLQRIRILLPPQALKDVQTVEIWMERDHPRLNNMQYHPSRQWLLGHGHDPRLAKKVHITQSRQLLSREQMLKHPAVLLHELAHGYHDQVLGFDHREVREVFEAARDAGSYESVLLYSGQEVRHYGLTNHKEYFAEGTEAYFYRNDFYPFVRAELKRHDPKLHALLQRIWEGSPTEDSD